MRKFLGSTAALLVLAFTTAAQAAGPTRVAVTGEVIDSWCYITEIMYGEGTAHYQCALWCAAGGIPVGILGDDAQVYIVLKMEDDATSVANPAIMRIESNRVSVEGDLFERDVMKYLLVHRVVSDQGIVNRTHEEYGIQPSGK